MKNVIVIAPNASEQMGGEAMKALQIYREFKALRPSTLLITHARNERELHGRLKLTDVLLVPDDAIAVLLWRSKVLRPWLDYWFCRRAVATAKACAKSRGWAAANVVLHQAEPNSPVLPRIVAPGHVNAFGPINGNIYYPAAFRRHEALWPRLRRLLHFPLQRLNKFLPTGLREADLILTAGGERTRNSLLAAGCTPDRLLDSVDCGIGDALLDRPRLQHSGENLRFVHFGRLVFHKGTFLIIKSLPKSRQRVCLDVVGDGPELAHCKALVAQLGLADRVRFITPYRIRDELLNALGKYRGMVLPSMEDANGMVVQEAMALGLPAICLDWGGPQLLVQSGKTGFLVEPRDEASITTALAAHMDRLAVDGGLAERFSEAGRTVSQDWRWSTVASAWLEAFDACAARPGGSHR